MDMDPSYGSVLKWNELALSLICFDQWITGPVELAAVGVSIAVFNQVSRIAIFPLVSVTTSFVAEDDAKATSTEEHESDSMEKAMPINREMEELSTLGMQCTLSSGTHSSAKLIIFFSKLLLH